MNAFFTTSKSRRDGDTDDTYYRVVDDTHSTWDPYDGDWVSSYPTIKVLEFVVARYTPKGASIRTGDSGAHDTRFVSNSSGKRFAWPTKELAMADYIKRKQMQANIFRQRANRCDQRRKMAEAMLGRYGEQKSELSLLG